MYCIQMYWRYTQSRTDGCFAVIIKCKRVLTAHNVKETVKIKILLTTDSVSTVGHAYLYRKWEENERYRGIPCFLYWVRSTSNHKSGDLESEASQIMVCPSLIPDCNYDHELLNKDYFMLRYLFSSIITLNTIYLTSSAK